MTEPTSPTGAPWRNFYGRRHGKKLRDHQAALLEEFLPRIAPRGVTWDENPARDPIALEALFGRDCPIWLEIGFGAGEHLVAQAKDNPAIGLIGCEPFVNGVAACLSKIERENLENIRVHAGDARDLLDVLPQASLDRAFLLYPDPWPKTRHHGRRFANPENLEPLARALKPGAILRVATDIEDYVRHTLEVIDGMPHYEWLAERPGDWREPWEDWHRTRYEAKAVREGRKPHYLTFRRV
ncbi:MAG: tRNA (guanosine(46)-N7)-methyltransferase TrmB [Rubricella sp.]